MTHQNINSLLDKYWQATTTPQEDQTLREYFNGHHVHEDHLEYQDLFVEYTELNDIVAPEGLFVPPSFAIEPDIPTLLDKYWAGETTVGEQDELITYFTTQEVDKELTKYAPLFAELKESRDIRTPEGLIKSPQSNKKEAKIISLSSRIKRYAAVAVLALGSIFLIKQTVGFNNTAKPMASNYTEVEDPELALEYTKQAFALLAKNYNKGSNQLTNNIGSVKEIKIFK